MPFQACGGVEKHQFVSMHCCWRPVTAGAMTSHAAAGRGSAASCLTSEAVQGAALALQGIHYVHGCDGLPAGVLCVGHCITHNVLQEHLEHTTGLLVDEAADTLHTTTASQTPDSRLGDALNVVAKHLPMALGSTLAKTLASLAASDMLAC
eukprot:GHUV01051798.1.p1 GENE.GHUV01051798.1~~GHUV01051798.1.p1  ORF type:complete len:151 (+),score=22.29 GHUV01051798.1:146-598(+)